MGSYTYKCKHEDCDNLAPCVRKCKSCGIVILTNVGVIQKDSDMFISADRVFVDYD